MIRLRAASLALAALLATGTLGGCGFVVVGGVTAAAIVAQDRRTTGTVIDDQGIEIRAASELRENTELDEQSHINVTSFNQVVLMTGETPTETMRAQAEQIVSGVDQVDKIFNEVVIAAPSALSARASDAWITTSVRGALVQLNSPDFDPNRVKVVTSRGTVYLMGILYPHEMEPVTETARRVSGVQRVVRLFEFLPPKEQAPGSTPADQPPAAAPEPTSTT
jgi:osmotically-inducible protein OsmY